MWLACLGLRWLFLSLFGTLLYIQQTCSRRCKGMVGVKDGKGSILCISVHLLEGRWVRATENTYDQGKCHEEVETRVLWLLTSGLRWMKRGGRFAAIWEAVWMGGTKAWVQSGGETSSQGKRGGGASLSPVALTLFPIVRALLSCDVALVGSWVVWVRGLGLRLQAPSPVSACWGYLA